MTTISNKEITLAWHQHFPSMAIYRNLQLLRRCGPILIGICLNRTDLSKVYKPIWHYHSLLRPFPAITLSMAVQLKAANGSDKSISFPAHNTILPELVSQMRALAPLPLEGDLSLQQFEQASSTWLIAQKSPYWPNLLEDTVLLRAWAGIPWEGTLQKIEKIISIWPENVTERMGGIQHWLSRIDNIARNREVLELAVLEEIRAHKLTKIPAGKFLR